MANKQFLLDNGQAVTVYKRRSSRNLRLSVNAHGQVKVTIPAWAPYRAGVDFARSKQDWITTQRPIQNLLTDGQAVGKAHHLYFENSSDISVVSTRLKASSVLVRYPPNLQIHDIEVQLAAQEACVRALRRQAENLLPQRIETLARQFGFEYGSIRVKRLKGCWGSCDQDKNIVLNLYLMQLPWPLIDYVLLHELTHTTVLRHGPAFWQAMERVLPDIKTVRKQIRRYQPVLNGSTESDMA